MKSETLCVLQILYRVHEKYTNSVEMGKTDVKPSQRFSIGFEKLNIFSTSILQIRTESKSGTEPLEKHTHLNSNIVSACIAPMSIRNVRSRRLMFRLH